MMRRYITLAEQMLGESYNGSELFAEIAHHGDVDAFNALVSALPDWTESGTDESFNSLTALLRPVMRYTSRIVRPNLSRLYFGTDRVQNPRLGMVLPRQQGDFHHWTAEEETARHFATLASRHEPAYGHGCVGEVPAKGVVLDVFWFTGALIEMPELPFNQTHGTDIWQGGWLEDEVITYQNHEPCKVIWTVRQ